MRRSAKDVLGPPGASAERTAASRARYACRVTELPTCGGGTDATLSSRAARGAAAAHEVEVAPAESPQSGGDVTGAQCGPALIEPAQLEVARGRSRAK